MIPRTGELDAHDTAANNAAVLNGNRIVSNYNVGDNRNLKVWIITESDRSVTTILLPSDY